jgi:hypothetical protein
VKEGEGVEIIILLLSGEGAGLRNAGYHLRRDGYGGLSKGGISLYPENAS